MTKQNKSGLPLLKFSIKEKHQRVTFEMTEKLFNLL